MQEEEGSSDDWADWAAATAKRSDPTPAPSLTLPLPLCVHLPVTWKPKEVPAVCSRRRRADVIDEIEISPAVRPRPRLRASACSSQSYGGSARCGGVANPTALSTRVARLRASGRSAASSGAVPLRRMVSSSWTAAAETDWGVVIARRMVTKA